MARPKIFLLTHEFPPKRGGAGVYCEEMAHAAAALGHEVEVRAPATPVSSGDGSPPYTLSPLPWHGSQDWRCSIRLIREVRKNAASFAGNVVHLAEPGALRAFIRLGFFARIQPARLLVTLHGSEIPLFCRFPPERFLFRRLLRRADRIHLLSRHNENALLTRFPELGPKIVLVPGAPRRLILPESRIPANSNEDSGSRLLMLTVGRLHPRKGQDRLLEAATSLPNKLKARLEYYIVGPETSPLYARGLREQAASSGIPVHFLGDLSDADLCIAYSSADLFALASVPYGRSVEGFGFVYLEAAAHGLPALAHRIGGVEDAVVHEQTGLLVPHDKPSELAQALERLITDSALRQRLGEAARDRAAGFSWERPAKALYGEA